MARILLVDDDIAEITAVKRLLARTAHRVQLATTAADAAGAIDRSAPDLLVVASGCDGGEALTLAQGVPQRGSSAPVPVVVLGDVPGLPPGVRVVTQPIDPARLGEAIDALLVASRPVSTPEIPRARAAADALRARAEELRTVGPPSAVFLGPRADPGKALDALLDGAGAPRTNAGAGEEDPRDWAAELAGSDASFHAGEGRHAVAPAAVPERVAPERRAAPGLNASEQKRLAECNAAAEQKAAAERKAAAEQKAATEQKVAAEQRAAAERNAAAERKLAEERRAAAQRKIVAEQRAAAERAAAERKAAAEQRAATERKRAEEEEEQLRDAIASARTELEGHRRRGAAEARRSASAEPEPDFRSSTPQARSAVAPGSRAGAPAHSGPPAGASPFPLPAPITPDAPSAPAPVPSASSESAPSASAPAPAASSKSASAPAPPAASSKPAPAPAPSASSQPAPSAPAPAPVSPASSRPAPEAASSRPAPEAASSPPAPSEAAASPPASSAPAQGAPSPAAPEPRARTTPTLPAPPDELQRGNLADLPAPRLLALAARARLAGRLDFEGAATRSLWFEAGRVVGAVSDDPEERVEALALRLGLVTRDQHLQVATQAATLPSRRAALLLLDRGFLKPAELTGLARRRTEEVVFGIFGEAEAQFEWSAEEVPADERSAVERPPLGLAVEGVRRRWGASQVDPLLGGPETLIAPLSDGPAIDRLALSREERRAVSLTDGLRTLDEVEQASPLDVPRTRQVLAALIQVGVLAVRSLGSPAGPEVARAIDLARVSDKLDQARRSDYFTVLGVPRSSTPHEIREAAGHLEAALDPRRHGADDALTARLDEILQVIRDARDVLADDRLRGSYLAALGDQ